MKQMILGIVFMIIWISFMLSGSTTGDISDENLERSENTPCYENGHPLYQNC